MTTGSASVPIQNAGFLTARTNSNRTTVPRRLIGGSVRRAVGEGVVAVDLHEDLVERDPAHLERGDVHTGRDQCREDVRAVRRGGLGSKGFVERYCQGLRNRLHAAGVAVVLVKPGPTDTPMARQLARPGRLADPADVARAIVRAIARRQSVVYTPGVWRWIMTVIRWIPERAFVRLKL